MTTQENLHRLIDVFHEAALQPEMWQPALAALGEAVGGSGVVVVSAYDLLGGAQLVKSVGYDLEYWDRVQAEHSTPETNRYIGMINSVLPGEVLQPRALMSLDDWLDDPIHRKFLRPDGLGDGLICPLFRTAGGFAAVATFRGQHYNSEHLRFLEAAAPYIRHALDVHLRLERAGADVEIAQSALDRLRAGIVLCDVQGRLITANLAAQRILDRSDGILLGRSGMLQAWKSDETNRLRALIKAAGDFASRDSRKAAQAHSDAQPGGSMRLSRSSAMAAVEVLVAPLRDATACGSAAGRATVIIFLSDPEVPADIEVLALRQMYGLTQAEGRLVAKLLTGMDMPAAAQSVGVSINTARTLLKRSFERTDTNRQSDLISKILRGPLRDLIPPR